MLRLEIRRVAGAAPAAGSAPGSDGRIVRVRTPMDIAACEVLDNQVMLVYAVVPRRDLLRMLWGSEVNEKVRRREMSRLTHGR